jgi:hypothetical protein
MNKILALKTMIPAAAVFALSLPAYAGLLTNGGFEAGFTDWTTADQAGSDGTFLLQTGASSPVSGDPVPAPPEGSTAAMTDSAGPGAHVLYRLFTVTSPVPAAGLAFDLFIGNRADQFYTPDPATLDFATPALNQQVRVDILAGGADPFSVAPADVLMTVFQTHPGDPLVSGYTRHAVNIGPVINSHLNMPLMLRFAETDNVFTFQLGVDNVDIQVVPEASTWLLMSGALCLAACFRRRDR